MSHKSVLAVLLLLTSPLAAIAQDAVPPVMTTEAAPLVTQEQEHFDTSYRPSPSVSARMQRSFLDRVRWASGIEARDKLAATFADRAPVDIWLDLVAEDGLSANNVVDALTAYWILNWVSANGAYAEKIDSAPVQRQLRIAFANEPNFIKLSDQKRQEMAEGYILNFLVEHAALNAAVEQKDVEALTRLAASSVQRFRQTMNVDLLTLVPSPDGFVGRDVAERAAGDTASDTDAVAEPPAN